MAQQQLREIEETLVQAVRDAVGQVGIIMEEQRHQQHGGGDINAGQQDGEGDHHQQQGEQGRGDDQQQQAGYDEGEFQAAEQQPEQAIEQQPGEEQQDIDLWLRGGVGDCGRDCGRVHQVRVQLF